MEWASDSDEGGGSVVMTVGGNGGTPVIRADTGGATLTNVNNTISGRGQLGSGNIAVTNQPGGTVNANSSGNTLLVNTTGAVNQGLFESSGGGVLQIAVTVNNAGGTITAGASSQVQFSNSSDIQGGLLSTASGAGFFGVIASNGVVLDGRAQGPLNNAATFTISNNADAELFGTIDNTGSFQVAANGNTTALSMSGAVILTGGGSVVMTRRWQWRHARHPPGYRELISRQRQQHDFGSWAISEWRPSLFTKPGRRKCRKCEPATLYC